MAEVFEICNYYEHELYHAHFDSNILVGEEKQILDRLTQLDQQLYEEYRIMPDDLYELAHPDGQS